MEDKLARVSFVLGAITFIVVSPIATIWSLNTLFPSLNIAYSLANWFAVFVLASIFKTTVTTTGK